MNLRCAVGWLVAGAIGMQALGVGFVLGRGAMHTHRMTPSKTPLTFSTTTTLPAVNTAIVLIDVRRAAFRIIAPTESDGPAHFFGHHHERGARHFHSPGDSSVVTSATERRIDAAMDDESHALDLVVAALMAVIATQMLWLITTSRHVRARHVGWQPSSAFLPRRDRPPQAG